MKHTLTLNMAKATMEQLEVFVDTAPADATLQTLVSWNGTANLEEHKTEDLTIELQAEWES